MPCMCGDTQCPSCGPAQGNFRCLICGAWADDCCVHLDETGNVHPEFQAQFDAIQASERAADEAYAAAMIEEAVWAAEYQAAIYRKE